MAELDALTPEPLEEDRLAARRTLLQNAERLAETLNESIGELTGTAGAQAALARATRRLERARGRAQGLLDEALAAAERAANETAEALAVLEAAARNLDLDPRELEAVEVRLFALRAAARKHQVTVADLPDLRDAIAARLATIETAPTAPPPSRGRPLPHAPTMSPRPSGCRGCARQRPAVSMPAWRPS